VTAAADFTISANPTSLTINAGASGPSTITVAPLNSFTGTVTLGVTTNSTSLSCILSATSIVGGTGTSTLSCTGSPAGNYLANVTGTSGTLTHSAGVTYHVIVVAQPDFTITANPTNVTMNVGAKATSTITISPVNGFASTVNLVLTTNSTSLTCTLSTTSITGGSGASILSCSASPVGNYLATIAGTIAGTFFTHATNVEFRAQDFGITANPKSVPVNAGVAGSSMIAISPVNGFTGAVALSITTNSTNLSCTLSSTSITGGSGTSTLSCTASSPGTYLSTVLATSGSLSHSASVTFIATLPTGKPVLLTFQGFDLDDFNNGVGQLRVFVNGNLVVDIPAGLNHLSGSGDFSLYDNTWVNFGPFDITSFVVQGQNTILFMDPQTSDHFGLVRNVTIVQGDTILLHVERARGVYPGFSFSYTFSNPPLMLKDFTASSSSPLVGQAVTFTAMYSGGTAPFKCVFLFGDGGSAVVQGINGMCTAVHHYYDSGSFIVKVIIIGSSTSDRVTGSLSVTVTGETEK
jgi:hypothetical protein